MLAVHLKTAFIRSARSPTLKRSFSGSTSIMAAHANLLGKAKSPYLLQHADNPVWWYEWGKEAFERAKHEDKPILLSVGYAACHWCHVMAHESFEDADVAKVMNDHFVSVKVDREERPDVDRIYMSYLQATRGRGGWPATYFLTPELTPIFAGTYFPKDAFVSVMRQFYTVWDDKRSRDDLLQYGKETMKQLQALSSQKSTASTSSLVQPDQRLKSILKHWAEDYDAKYGGFGGEPKFPSSALTFYPLNRVAAYAKDPADREKAVSMVVHTLKNIERGGINDHVGTGIARYSVDEKWLLPHFEKMLYDQAQLLSSALDAALLAPDERDRVELEKMAAGIVNYLEKDLQNQKGGFFCAEDADSLPGNDSTIKKEGAFYVWTHDDLKKILGSDVELFEAHFGVKANGNIPKKHDIQGELEGTNCLAQQHDIEETAAKYDLSPVEAREKIDACLSRLKAYRDEHRPRPHLDDKVLTAWNGLTISALARAAEHLFVPREEMPALAARAEFLENINSRALGMAEKAVDFIKENLWDAQTKTLHRSFRQGKGPHAQADDYAFFIQGLLDLYEASGKEKYLAFALELQERQDELFLDKEHGGYFASPVGDPYVIIRMKEHQEGAEPTAAGVSVSNLYRLGLLIYDKADEYETKARGTVASAGTLLDRASFALGTLATNALLDGDAKGQLEIIVTGPSRDADTREFLSVIRSFFIPHRVLIQLSPDEDHSFLKERNEVVKELVSSGQNNTPAVRICVDKACGLPISDRAELAKQLNDL